MSDEIQMTTNSLHHELGGIPGVLFENLFDQGLSNCLPLSLGRERLRQFSTLALRNGASNGEVNQPRRLAT